MVSEVVELHSVVLAGLTIVDTKKDISLAMVPERLMPSINISDPYISQEFI